MANAVPDSRTPRRFISAMTATTSTAMSVTWGSRIGKAEARLATPGGDRHRHGQGVVHHQGASHDQAHPGPEVGGGHLVVPAAGRVGMHVLPVRRDQHEHAHRQRNVRV